MRDVRKAIDMYQNKPLVNRTRLLTTDACQAILYVYLFKRSIKVILGLRWPGVAIYDRVCYFADLISMY